MDDDEQARVISTVRAMAEWIEKATSAIELGEVRPDVVDVEKALSELKRAG